MRVKITGIPKESTLPTNRVNPFSVPDEFKYGGNLPNQGGNPDSNRRIDTYSDFLRQPMKGTTYQQSPYAATGKQLPEVPEGTPDAISVEKKEQVMGDFNGDGMPVLMGSNVGSHESGNDLTTVVPDGSFVFSDTPSLKIKDPQILEMFGMKKPATPAAIAKKYPLQDYKKILDDKERGEVDKNTARLMYGNYTEKLNMLASVQEEMKKKQEEMRQGRQYKTGGYIPQYPTGGPTYPYYGGSVIENQDDMVHSKPQAAWFAQNIMGAPAAGNLIDSQNGYRTQFLNAAEQQQPWSNPTDENIPSVPYTGIQSPQATTMNTIPVPGLPSFKGDKKGKDKGNKEGVYNNRHSFNPDTLAAVTAGMRALQYPDYNPIKQVAHGAIPQAVYMDPTRAKAAIQEGVNSAGNSIAMGATGPVARANILALQGKAGSAAADIKGQYAQKNAEIANRTNEQAASIYNQLWKDQQNYNKEYVEETHNAQMDKLGYQATTQNELLKQAYMAENRKRTAQNYNYVNPYYTMDSRGYIYPKSEEQLRDYKALGDGRPGGQGNALPSQAVEKLLVSGKYDADTTAYLRRLAARRELEGMLGPVMTERVDPRTGLPVSISKKGRDLDGDGTLERRGGPIKKSKVKIIGLPSR